MSKRNQEAYETLGWIINESEKGFFLLIADEAVQSEISEIYSDGNIGVYDYKENPGTYSFQKIADYVEKNKDLKTFLILNFQFSLQTEQDLKRLNFSRDMLAALEKNLIFVITPYGDELLVKGAYDFYSFFKARLSFENDKEEVINNKFKSLENMMILPDEDEIAKLDNKQKLDLSYTLLDRGRKAAKAAAYDESIQSIEMAIKILQGIFETDHLELAKSYNVLGCVYEKLGEYKKAMFYLEKALMIREKAYGEEHPEVATSCNNIGSVYADLGMKERALSYYEKALNILQKVYGKEYIGVALGYNNIGSLYDKLGEYEKALGYYEKSLNILQKIREKDDLDIAVVYNNIGSIYWAKGDCEKALSYYEKSLNIRIELNGEHHPSVAELYNNMGTVYSSLKDSSKALVYFEKALEILKEVYGEKHPDIATDYNNMGTAYVDLNNEMTILL